MTKTYSQAPTIQSTTEFCQLVLGYAQASDDFADSDISKITFYRGQVNFDWQLSPRLFRESLFFQERTLIEELCRIKPLEFDGISYFDRLVKMQHYGLPTRLLDMTLNPLVALFFACHDVGQINEDGAVFIFPGLPVFRPQNWSVQLIITYVFELSQELNNIPRMAEQIESYGILDGNLSREATERTILDVLTKMPFIAVMPSLRNERVQNQDGAFFICNMEIDETVSSDRKSSESNNILAFKPRDFGAELENIWRGASVVRVAKESKPKIIEELRILGITKARLFPELENQAHFITELAKLRGS